MVSTFAWYFLSLHGRVSRQEFRLGYIGLIAVCGVLLRMLGNLAFYNSTGRLWYRDELDFALRLPILVADLILIWPIIAIFVKRLHDLNVSGWWLLVALTIPFVSKLTHMNPSTLALMAVVIMSSIPGSTGSNRFGLNPTRVKTDSA
jgi:uncharacterized membrane protein YhaH (DUF805 family)